MVVNEDHRVHVLLGSLPSLPHQSVVELLSGRVDPFGGGGRDGGIVGRGEGSRDGRGFSFCLEEFKLVRGERSLSEVGHLVERVDSRVIYRASGESGILLRRRGSTSVVHRALGRRLEG